MNVQWSEDGLVQFDHADIAIVVALPGGLTTPVVRQADLKSISAIASESRSLIERARAGSLKLDEIVGGSFGISNLGMFGVESFDAIVNPPHCAMLAVGCSERMPIVGADGGFEAATLITLTLSVDHRAVDGVTAAQFLGALKALIETPERWVERSESV